jgi:ATP-binding cassette subfamily B protein
MKLPITFFDSRSIGDLMQRIDDNKRIETFLSTSTLSAIFSVFNLFTFSLVLGFYNLTILLIFLGGSILYLTWALLFMKKRAVLDYKTFDQASGNSSHLIELISAMSEIKLNNSERMRRWEWEAIRIKIYKLSIKGLALMQYQTIGSNFINQIKNVVITIIAAKAVIEGDMTIGMMLAIQYIIGQLNEPLNEFLTFMRSTQDAKISLERMGDVHDKDNEDSEDNMEEFSTKKSITLANLSFQYGGPSSPFVLKDLNLTIPEGKVTAIVGASGSGKTTLLKLLLKFYKPTSGTIMVGSFKLQDIKASFWRKNCGVVMQDGFTFTDSIAKNICESDAGARIDKAKLLHAVRIANLENVIEEFPTGYNTRIGPGGGIQLSGGQKQRVLISRAVYKNPDFLFFDEATSALDANNEKIIMQNLEEFYKGRTVVIIAHRLSTVKNADNIIVLEKGSIVEQGTHHELVEMKDKYYTLVKNQLELGK